MATGCTSCKVDVSSRSGAAKFMCPNCNEKEIVRCGRCRKLATKYQCACGFEGP